MNEYENYYVISITSFMQLVIAIFIGIILKTVQYFGGAQAFADAGLGIVLFSTFIFLIGITIGIHMNESEKKKRRKRIQRNRQYLK